MVVVTGPPGAGKSTVCGILAQAFDRSAVVDGDRIFGFIREGYHRPWLAEAHPQNATLMRIIGDSAIALAGAGYATFIDSIVGPRWFFAPLRDQLRGAGHEMAYVILRPPLEACVQRAAERADREGLDRAVIERVWAGFHDVGELEANVIDDGRLTAHEIAELVRSGLSAGRFVSPRE